MENEFITMRASDNSVVRLEYHERLDSTVELAKKYATNGYPDRYVVVSDYEKSKDAYVKGLYMSCILKPSLFPSQAGLLTALAAVSCAVGLEGHTKKKIGIGWVGKIYCDGKIIGNVTLEGKLDNFTTYEYIILNFSIKLSNDDFPPRLTDMMKKVFEKDNASTTVIFAKNILNKFLPLYVNIKNDTKFMNVYKQKFILTGKKIKLINSDGKKSVCKVLGVNPEYGTLTVEDKRGEITEIKSPNSVIIPKTVKLPKKSSKKGKLELQKKNNPDNKEGSAEDKKEQDKTAPKK